MYELDSAARYVVACRVGVEVAVGGETVARRRIRPVATSSRRSAGIRRAPARVRVFLKRRRFGATGIDFPVVGQGTWDMPETGAAVEDAQRAIRRGIDLGMTHIDTAEMYGAGRVEELLGAALRGVPRESYLIATKVLPSNASYRGTLEAAERSIARLGCEHLDLFLLHWPGTHAARRDDARVRRSRGTGKDALRRREQLRGRRHARGAILSSFDAARVQSGAVPPQRARPRARADSCRPGARHRDRRVYAIRTRALSELERRLAATSSHASLASTRPRRVRSLSRF